MHSDSEQEAEEDYRRGSDFKIKRFLEQSQLYLNRLSGLKQQLNNTDRSHEFDSYAQKLNEIGKIVQNLAQNIRNIEQLNTQLTDKDRTKLDRQIRSLRADIDRELAEYQTLRDRAMTASLEEPVAEINSTSENAPVDGESNGLRQRHALAVTTSRLNDSYDLLEQDLILLRETMGEVAQLVAQQREKVSHAEQLIHMAHDQIRHASTFLQRAVQSKYLTVASGAVIGATLGGPIGCVMGLKIGALAALSGSAVGALSVNIMQHRKTRDAECKENHESYSQAML